jgi:hypothetical protein
MNANGVSRRSIAAQTPLALAAWTVAVSALAACAAYFARWPCCTRLQHAIFFRLFAFDDFRAACLTTAVVALVAWVPAVQRAGAALARALSTRPALSITCVFLALAAGTQVVYLDHALSMDEYAPRFQAHAFASGAIGAHWPVEILDRIVLPEFRGYFLFTDPATGLTTSVYWPGLALLMTPLAAFDLEWLVNPALSALALWLIVRLASDLARDPRAGGWALLFALASPAFAVNAMSFYAMPGLLALDLLFAWLLTRESVVAAGLAGLAGGLALALHNPFPHVLFAAPWLLWLAVDRTRWRRLVAALCGYLPLGAGLGIGWPLTVAHLGIDSAVVADTARGLAEGWRDRLHLIFRLPGYELITVRLDATWKAWIWSCPGLIVLCIMALGRGVKTRWERLLAASLLTTYLGYFLVTFDQGHGWGYRYLHSAWGVLPILAGIFAAQRATGPDGSLWQRWCGGLALAGCLVSPFFMWQVRANIAENVRQRIEVPERGYWVVFVTPQKGLYSGDVIQNFPGRTRVLTLSGHGSAEDQALMARWFPGARRAVDDGRGSAWQLAGPPLPLQAPRR